MPSYFVVCRTIIVIMTTNQRPKTKVCKKCQKTFRVYVNGMDLNKRRLCTDCQPYKAPRIHKTNTCKQCGKELQFDSSLRSANGKIINLSRRSYCLDCSPFGEFAKNEKPVIDGKRECFRCKQFKPLLEFRLTKGRWCCNCNPCERERINEYSRILKQKAIDHLGGKCQVCGYNRCMRSLVFHSKDPAQKEFSLGRRKCINWEDTRKELDKCLLLCANCHGGTILRASYFTDEWWGLRLVEQKIKILCKYLMVTEMMTFREFLLFLESKHSEERLDNRIDQVGRNFPAIVSNPGALKAEVRKNTAIAKVLYGSTGKAVMVWLAPKLKGEVIVFNDDGTLNSRGDTIRGIFRPCVTGAKECETTTTMFRSATSGQLRNQPVDIEKTFAQLQQDIKANRSFLASEAGQEALEKALEGTGIDPVRSSSRTKIASSTNIINTGTNIINTGSGTNTGRITSTLTYSTPD